MTKEKLHIPFPVIVEGKYDKIRLSNIMEEQIITTDAVPIVDDLGGRIKVISIAPLLGEAIRRIHDGKSVSSLFYINH